MKLRLFRTVTLCWQESFMDHGRQPPGLLVVVVWAWKGLLQGAKVGRAHRHGAVSGDVDRQPRCALLVRTFHFIA